MSAIEGVDTLEHPGIIYRGPGHDRRAALAVGPDVWEIIYNDGATILIRSGA